jgi:hypothetical protein
LIELLATGVGGASGIGGSNVRLDVEGIPVFAKCVPVTDLEMAAENRGSTANLFDLPTMYHYGVGSTGTNVWRELAAHHREPVGRRRAGRRVSVALPLPRAPRAHGDRNG